MVDQMFVVTRQRSGISGHRKQMQSKNKERVAPGKLVGRLWPDANLIASADSNNISTNGTDLTDLPSSNSTFAMVDAMVQHAVQDATQSADCALRWEALAWLWVCCPDIADQLRLPWPEATDVAQQAAAYMDRYPPY